MRNNPLDYSRQLDVYKWSDFPEIKEMAQEIYLEVLGYEADEGLRKRKRTEKSSKKLFKHLRVVLIDLFVAWFNSPDLYLTYSRNKASYSGESRWSKLFLSYQPMVDVMDRLEALDYIEHHKGFQDAQGNSKESRVRARERLVQVFERYDLNVYSLKEYKRNIIVLKDSYKKEISFGIPQPVNGEETPRLYSYEKSLDYINMKNSYHMISLFVKDSELLEMQEKLSGCNDTGGVSRVVDFSDVTLHRTFNNGSFEQGGRFYGAFWQQIPKEYRRYLTIDNEPTVELDFSGMHVDMMYREKGLELDGDAYALDGYSSECRPVIKKVFNAMINAKSKQIGRRGLDLKNLPEGKLFKDLKADIVNRHKHIEEFFFTGKGLELQAIDAQIAERIMVELFINERFTERSLERLCVLPVHDSFIVPDITLDGISLVDEVELIMKDVYMSFTGGIVNVDRTLSGINSSMLVCLNKVSNIIEKDEPIDSPYLENLSNDYSKYIKRGLQWLDYIHTIHIDK